MSKRTTTRQSNPRYLISRDGVEVGYYPGFTSVEAIKRAKIHYGAGKYTAEKVDSSMYLGRGAERTQARERRERQEARHAERMEMAKRRNSGKEKTYITKNQLMEIIFSKNLDVHPYTLGKYPYKVQWKFRDGKIFAIEFPDKTVLIDTKHLLHKNGTHIHAENIDHLDVSRVHNPSNSDEFVAVSYFNRNALADDVIFLPLAEPYDVKRTFDTIAAYKGAGAHTFPIYLGIGENEYGEPEQYQRLNKYVIVDTVHQTVQPLAINPQRPVRRYEYTLGTWWQPYIVYGDDSDVTIEDIEKWNAFRKRLPPSGHWSFNEDTYFGKDDVTGKRGDVSDAHYVIIG